MERKLIGRLYSPVEIETIIERVRAIDPDVVAAADEFDPELSAWFLTLEPVERLRRGLAMRQALERLRGAVVRTR